MNRRLQLSSYRALLAGAQRVSLNGEYDQKGYAPHWEANLREGLPLTDIAKDFETGAGRELGGKFRAAHSSAAFAVNTFGIWRSEPSTLHLAGETGFRQLRFEVTFPTGLGGTPPHLDLVAEGRSIVAIESKCTEWMSSKPAVFSASYDRLKSSLGGSPWFEQMQQLRVNASRYRFLDAAQLVKHAFGLMSRFKSRQVQLVYFYWEPLNANNFLDCRKHRAEIEDLADRVRSSTVTLIPLSCHQLWLLWGSQVVPPAHLSYLTRRYAVEA